MTQTVKAPKTIDDAALFALKETGWSPIGVHVKVWDNELDETLDATVVQYNAGGWPLYVVELWRAGQPEVLSASGNVVTHISMTQGPYHDSGRWRIVQVCGAKRPPAGQARAARQADVMPPPANSGAAKAILKELDAYGIGASAAPDGTSVTVWGDDNVQRLLDTLRTIRRARNMLAKAMGEQPT